MYSETLDFSTPPPTLQNRKWHSLTQWCFLEIHPLTQAPRPAVVSNRVYRHTNQCWMHHSVLHLRLGCLLVFFCNKYIKINPAISKRFTKKWIAWRMNKYEQQTLHQHTIYVYWFLHIQISFVYIHPTWMAVSTPTFITMVPTI